MRAAIAVSLADVAAIGNVTDGQNVGRFSYDILTILFVYTNEEAKFVIPFTRRIYL